MSWELDYSFRLLKSRKRKSVFSPMVIIAICGIAFGVTALLVSISVISGFQRLYEEAILGFNAHMVLVEEGEIDNTEILGPILQQFVVTPEEAAMWKKDRFTWSWLAGTSFYKNPKMDELSRKGIVAATPFIYREGLGLLPEEVKGVVLKGVEPDRIREVYPLRFSGMASDPSSFDPETALAQWKGERPPVIIGKPLFRSFFPTDPEGDAVIKVMVPKGEGEKLSDYAQEFQVIGLFESGLYEFDSQFLLTSIPVMEKMFGMEGRASGMEIILDDKDKAPRLARIIERELPSGFEAISWDELNEHLFSAMKMEKTLFLIIMFLIIFIAAFNVMGIILMLVIHRQKDIAILKILGASKKSLNTAFALQGLYLGLLGIFLGTGLSAFLLWTIDRFKWFSLDPEIYFISKLPVDWSLKTWVALIIGALLICYGISRLAAGLILRRGALTQSFR